MIDQSMELLSSWEEKEEVYHSSLWQFKVSNEEMNKFKQCGKVLRGSQNVNKSPLDTITQTCVDPI